MQVAANSRNVCLEDTVGDLFRKMVLTDALVYTGVMLMSFVMVKTVYKGKKIECANACCIAILIIGPARRLVAAQTCVDYARVWLFCSDMIRFVQHKKRLT